MKINVMKINSEPVIVFQTNVSGNYRKGYAGYLFFSNKIGNSVPINQRINNYYPIETMDSADYPVSLKVLKYNIDRLLLSAALSKSKIYKLIRISSHDKEDVGPMLANAPSNIRIPYIYKDYIHNPDIIFWHG